MRNEQSILVDGVELNRGDRVRLWPSQRADVLDVVLQGMTAIIESFEQDLEDRIYVTVTLEDDPGRDFGIEQQPGHRFFFTPNEIELLESK